MKTDSLLSRSLQITAFALLLSVSLFAQKTKLPVPVSGGAILTEDMVKIVKAEDERRWDKTLEKFLQDPSAAVRKRAALAAGRIGDEASVPVLSSLLETDADAQVRVMAAFALGETEVKEAADAVLKALTNEKENDEVRARAIEAAGKIAAANKNVAEKLGEAILDALDAETSKTKQNKQLVLLGITAVLRVRPAEGDFVTAKFLTNLDARVRADACNTLARLRAKNANETLHALLLSDGDAVVRANAARALGAAEDSSAFNLLSEAAVSDEDLRVRVSAIRALGSLKDPKAAEKLIEHGEMLLNDYKKTKTGPPAAKNELLEIATTLGRILPNSNNEDAIRFLEDLRLKDGYVSPETETAYIRIAPAKFFTSKTPKETTWRTLSAFFQGLAEYANVPETGENKEFKKRAGAACVAYIRVSLLGSETENKALGDALGTLAALKVADDLDDVLRDSLEHKDVVVRAAAAGSLADQPASKENIAALKTAFSKALLTDKLSDDALLAIMDALFKLDKKESVGVLLSALFSPDYLVRKKAFELLKTPGLDKDYPGLPSMLASHMKKNEHRVLPYSFIHGTKLGQVLNAPADYTRAVSRKNGAVRAVVTTAKGAFTIDLLPEDAPLTVDNFIKLARTNYFDGVSVHRVVPNFVMQDGDPRGDGNGGPGWSIRCEMNMVSYGRGAVGTALSGKDTGGSQWFVTHAPQPHLDGGYTVFGTVNETGMKIVDNIARGDKIISIKVVEGSSPQKITKGAKK